MQGLVAVIVTVHQIAVLLGVASGLALGLLCFVLFRAGSGARRLALALTLGIGIGLVTLGISAHLLRVAPLDVEVVSLD